jgi:bacillithiol biosynthesis deacetylase BshB1
MPTGDLSQTTLDVLAIAAHRDDVEQTCGGTLLVQQSLGWHTGILDLTQGESGTRGTAEDRAREAAEAARILRVSHREALDLPDGNVENTRENRLKIAAVLRRLRPRVVILPYWQGRHPDHYTTATLGYEACFAAGLSKLDLPPEHGAPHRPYKILYASLYADVRPTFVVDITPHYEQRRRAILAFASQFHPKKGESPKKFKKTNVFLAIDRLEDEMNLLARHYGEMIGVKYGEPYLVKELMQVHDVVDMDVRSI